MSDSPESLVRSFLATWENTNVADLDHFISEDATYMDPRGPQNGLDSIKKLVEADSQISPGVAVEIKVIASNGGTVIVERVDTFHIQGKQFSLDIVGVFEVGNDGRITRWREYYDSKSATEMIEAAGISVRD
jgi:limonene-1,2-epoxide hydrolase